MGKGGIKQEASTPAPRTDTAPDSSGAKDASALPPGKNPQQVRSGSLNAPERTCLGSQNNQRYFVSPPAGGTAPGKIPSIGARFFCSRSGCGSGLRGSI